MRTIPKILRPLLRLKTSVGSISAHDITSGSRASSEKGAEDAGAPRGSAFRPSFVLPSAHHWRIPLRPSSSFVGPLFSQSRHRSTAAAGNCRQPFRLRFFLPVPVATIPRSSNPPIAARTPRPELRRHLSFATTATSSPELRRHLTFATRAAPSPEFHLAPELRRHLSFATRTPSSPELGRHLSFATRAPPSTEFHLSPELRRHSSFTTRYLPFSELHLRQSFVVTCASLPELLPARRFVVTCRHLSFATRAPSSSELHLPPELHLRLPRQLHSMSFPFKSLSTTRQSFFSGPYHRPRRRRHHLLRQSGNCFTDFCSHAPMGLPLQTATSGEAPSSWPLPPTPASSTVVPDQLRHILPTPAAAAPLGLLRQSATNRPGVTAIVGNFGPSLRPIPTITPSSSLRTKLTPSPREPQASPQTHFKGLLQRQRLRLYVRCGTRTFHRRVRDPTPSSTNHIELLQPRLRPSQSSYRFVREHPALSGSCSELFNAFYWTIIRLQRSYHIFREHHDVTVSLSERCSTP